jgi:hypothetical protein
MCFGMRTSDRRFGLNAYCAWDFNLPIVGLRVDPTFVYKSIPSTTIPTPKFAAVSLGCHVVGAAALWPHTHDADNAILGFIKRVAVDMPPYDEGEYKSFCEFSFAFILKHMGSCVLEYDSDRTVERWLAGTTYPAYRKEELLRVSGMHNELTTKDKVVSSHIKYESYMNPKYPRTINSRSDFFKTKFGPACAEVGRRFFNLPWLIKKLSQSEKIDRLERLFDNCYLKAFNNDFTAYEGMFKKHMMIIELFFYAFCLQNIPEFVELWTELKSLKTGVNFVRFTWFWVKILAKRYSGEMDTSLANGLMNVLMMNYMLFRSGHEEEFYTVHHPPQIEGDDCIGVFMYPLDVGVLKRLGAVVKLVVFDSFREASFCGILVSDDSRSIIRDPIHAVLDFGYTHYKYKHANDRKLLKLLRAKSLSFLVMYPGCPIVRELALYGLRVTSNVSNRHALATALRGTSDSYKRAHWISLIEICDNLFADVPVSMGSRLQMEKSFGVHVSFQYEFESYLSLKNDLSPIDYPPLLDYVSTDLMKYFDQFSVSFPLSGSPHVNAGWAGRAWRKLCTSYLFFDV